LAKELKWIGLKKEKNHSHAALSNITKKSFLAAGGKRNQTSAPSHGEGLKALKIFLIERIVTKRTPNDTSTLKTRRKSGAK